MSKDNKGKAQEFADFVQSLVDKARLRKEKEERFRSTLGTRLKTPKPPKEYPISEDPPPTTGLDKMQYGTEKK